MSMLLLPHSQLVAVAWLRGVPGLPVGVGIGQDLPADTNTWTDGFIHVGIVGGDRDRDTPIRRPAFQITCWAANRNGARPPWGKANQLAEIICSHCDTDSVDYPTPTGRLVALSGAYQTARVHGAQPLTEPRQVDGDEARYAGFQFDLLLTWSPVVTP